MKQDSKSVLAKIRSNLRRTGADFQVAGDEGEALTRILLDTADVGWFAVEQEEDTKSRGLKAVGAKRVDFVVGSNGGSILLDAKCLYHEFETDGSVVFSLATSEIERLRKTGEMFGLDVAVIFWSRRMQKERFVIDWLNRLSEPTTIRDRETGEDKPARSARFEAHEICELDRG